MAMEQNIFCKNWRIGKEYRVKRRIKEIMRKKHSESLKA